MSWNVSVTKQSPGGAAAAVAADANTPSGVRDYLLQVIGNLAPLRDGEALDLSTSGHVDANGGEGKFSIKKVAAGK